MKQSQVKREERFSELPPPNNAVAEIDGSLRIILSHLVDVGDKATQLPLRQLHVCVLLIKGPLSMSQLSQKLRCSMSATTQLADRLERTGLIARFSSDTDRRVRCLKLTSKGRRALQTHDGARLRRLNAVFQGVDELTRQKIMAGLKLFQEACLQVNVDNESSRAS
jgi:DNA-binding MarR family transcriptional regulator